MLTSKLIKALGKTHKIAAKLEKTKKMKEISKFMIVISLTIVVMLSVQSIAGQAIDKTVFTSHGTVKTIGVNAFLDSECTNPVTSLEWGILQPGNTISKSFYLLNQGNAPAVLQLYAENWNSYNAEQYLVLSWNYGSQSISPGEAIYVTFTLYVSPNISGVTDFNFDVVIVAS